MSTQAESAIKQVFESLGGFTVIPTDKAHDGFDLLIRAKSDRGADIVMAVQAKSRITPQIAIPTFEAMRATSRKRMPVLYAPVVSDRVAQIAKEYGISFVDGAGNCFLRSPNDAVLIERTGLKGRRRKTKRIVSLFAPKASRVVRVMLQNPAKGWRVRELAAHPDVNVSPGMAQKVKSGLMEEGYAVLHKRKIFLRDPIGLLQNWKQRYRGPSRTIDLYVRGDVLKAEESMAKWCKKNELTWALGGMSAAWRLAPEVRYPVGSVYIEDRAFQLSILDTLFASGVKQVESGANLRIWQAYDDGVFANYKSYHGLSVTSAIQTYLDVSQLAGRGEEAGEAVYEKYLRRSLADAEKQVKEMTA